jgi:membrane-associated phospholipid phosphatase
MKTFVRNNAIFLLLSLTLCGVLGLAILCLSKGDLHLLLCNRHTHARDIFYKYYTQVAEWFPYVVCISLLLCSKIGNGILASSCLIISALTTQLLKHIFIAPRPITWFATNMPQISLPLVDGMEVHSWFSFPSGHTTSFFALMFVITIITTDQIQKNKIITICTQIICFLLATLGAYSRIYLSQHFALDVLGGLIVGIGICFACYAFFIRYKGKKWYNYRLFSKKCT